MDSNILILVELDSLREIGSSQRVRATILKVHDLIVPKDLPNSNPRLVSRIRLNPLFQMDSCMPFSIRYLEGKFRVGFIS